MDRWRRLRREWFERSRHECEEHECEVTRGDLDDLRGEYEEKIDDLRRELDERVGGLQDDFAALERDLDEMD
jgi:hypothetical protein